jgi:predicted PurR-regulated permease PerM
MIVPHFLLISHATVFGTLIIGITQGTIGALTLLVFGVMGFIVGPVIAALFVFVLDIYKSEFERRLKDAH